MMINNYGNNESYSILIIIIIKFARIDRPYEGEGESKSEMK